MTWTNLSGLVNVSQSPYVNNAVERTGAGGINDHSATDNASVMFSFELQPIKSVIATNQTHTNGLDVAIGESAQYELVVHVPDDTIFTDVLIQDTLDPGLRLVSFDGIAVSGSLASSS